MLKPEILLSEHGISSTLVIVGGTRTVERQEARAAACLYWDQVINLWFLADEGTIRDEHLSLMHYAETQEEAWKIIREYYLLP